MPYTYKVKRLKLRRYIFGSEQKFWCVVRCYKDQIYHHYHGYSYRDKEDSVYKCSSYKEAMMRLKSIVK